MANAEFSGVVPTWGESIQKMESVEKKYDYVIPSSLYHEFDIQSFDEIYDVSEEALKQGRFYYKPFVEWLCTDTMVGIYFYYVDGECVCASIQSARKNDTIYYFFSEELREKTRNFLLAMIEKKEYYNVVALTDKMPRRI